MALPSLAQKIAVFRWARHMSQQELADKMGVSRPLVSAWEAGRSIPNSGQLAVLARVLDLETSSLLVPDIALPDQETLVDLAKGIIKSGEDICRSLSDDLQVGAFYPVAQDAIAFTRREQRAHETGEWQHPLDETAHQRFLSLILDTILPFFPRGLIVFSEESIELERDERKPAVYKQRMQPILLFKDAETHAILFQHGTKPVHYDDWTPGSSYQLDREIGIKEYVIIDPLDRTAEAVRGIAGFANLTVGSLAYGPLLSVVFVLFDQYVSCYYAITGGGAWVRFRNGTERSIAPSTVMELSGASLGAYVGRPVRLARLADCRHLAQRHGSESTFVNVSGSYGFCLVAASQMDAFIEVAKGYAWHDIVSGAHILQEAGGVIKTIDFTELADPLDSDTTLVKIISNEDDVVKLGEAWEQQVQNKDTAGLYERQEDPGDLETPRIGRTRFIAAATYELGAQIAIELARDQVPDVFSAEEPD